MPKVVDTGGPLISLEVADEEDTLTVVWMSISTRQNPIHGYYLSLNDKRCPQMISPEADSARCKAVIEGCILQRDYKIQVLAVPINGKFNFYIRDENFRLILVLKTISNFNFKLLLKGVSSFEYT